MADQARNKTIWSQTQADEIASLRTDMLRFAMLQLRDATLAEDTVHEAINAALSSSSFENRASIKSWVFSILRNKILDVFRERARHPTESYTEDEAHELDALFDERDHWDKDSQPANWGQPEAALASDQFWVIFELCLTQLPENTARVFMMREHMGLTIAEICQELHLSDSNAWVIMHRARGLLRKCLEINYMRGN